MTGSRQIGRYQVLGELGRGAMGVVYRAIDPAIGRTVAIKTIRLSSVTPAERRLHLDQLRKEAQTAGRLSHPGIVTVFDFFESGDEAFVCMECVEGPTLESMLASGRKLSAESAIQILTQAADALDYAHSKGIVHRDVKPGNLMLHEDRIVKVTDFGIAKVLSEDATIAGPMLGTPNYMSPEQVQSRPVGGSSDQFSLAVIAYELLTGERPFNAYSVASIVYRVCNEQPGPASGYNAKLSPAVDAVLARALSKDPALRYSTVGQFVRHLSSALAQCPAWTPMPRGHAPAQPTMDDLPVSRPKRPPVRARYAGLIATLLAVGGFAVIALVIWIAATSRQPTVPPASSTASLPPATDGASSKPSPGVEPQPPSTAVVPQPAGQQPANEKVETQPIEAPSTIPGGAAQTPLPPQAPPAAKEPASVISAHAFRIDSVPSGATINIDNIPSYNCVTPCRITVSGGRHTFKAQLDGYRPQLKVSQVPEEEAVMFQLERRTGTVIVRSNPPGASIFIDGREWSTKTPTMLTLGVGQYKLLFKKDGYRDQESAIEVRDGTVANLDINWIPNQ